jgi:hypothetical protein
MKEFRSFGAFASHLERLALEGEAVKHYAVDQAAQEIQLTAQGMVGEYQQAIGPFAEWEELADSTKAERTSLGFSENDPGFRTGAMQKSIERKVEGAEAAVGSDDPHLVWFDQGTSRQPPRPILGPAAMHSKERVQTIIGRTMFAWLASRGWRRPRIKP